MIVIVIIGILAGLLLPAVMKSRQAASVQAARAEISSLAMAIDSFKNDFGFYPPTAYPFDPDPSVRSFSGIGPGGNSLYGPAYAYSEALVHCLANKWTRGAGDETSGTYPANIKNLSGDGSYVARVIGNAPVNAGPYFEVKSDKLTDLDQDGWPELSDPWGNPYIYVPEGDYLASGTNGRIYYAGALVPWNYDGDTFTDPLGNEHENIEWGIGQDDAAGIYLDPLPEGYVHHNRFTFQLISRGPDGWTPGIDNVTDEDNDGRPDGYRDISIDWTDSGGSGHPRPDLVGTDTDAANPVVNPANGHEDPTADDINNW